MKQVTTYVGIDAHKKDLFSKLVGRTTPREDLRDRTAGVDGRDLSRRQPEVREDVQRCARAAA